MTATTTRTANTTPPLDTGRTEQLGGRLLQIINDSSLALMISIGHRTGLFDVMSTMAPATSQAIADGTGLQERYVREWLGAMVVGRIVEYDADARTYYFPREHAALLTRAAEPENFASMMQWVSVLGSVEDRVIKSFHEGGGVHYCHFDRFHEVMASESAQTVIAGLEDHILPLVPGLAERLEAGIDVLDIGCGSGFAMIHLAERFPQSRFSGYDLCEDAIARGQAEIDRKGLANVTLEMRDVSQLQHAHDFDLITAFDAIHDQARPDVVLRQIADALRADGVFLMQDIGALSYLEKNMDHPLGPLFYTISTMHCMTVSLAQGGAGLGTVWGEELAVRMLGEAGFEDVAVCRLDHDIQNNYYVARKR